jgi:hypothetical protein
MHTSELRNKHSMLQPPPACPVARHHPLHLLPPVLQDHHLAPQNMAVWEIWHLDLELTPPTKCLIPCKSEHGLTTHRTNPVSDHRVSYGRCHELVQMFRGLLDYLRRGVALDCQDAKHVSHCFVFIVHGLA